MQQVADPGRDFPPIRMMGTLGWIFINLIVGFMKIEATPTPFLLGAGGLRRDVRVTAWWRCRTRRRRRAARRSPSRQILGLDALAMMKDRSYLVFVIASFLACIPLTFYYSFTNLYLNEAGVVNAAGKMSLGQMSEVGMMLAMPLVFRLCRSAASC